MYEIVLLILFVIFIIFSIVFLVNLWYDCKQYNKNFTEFNNNLLVGNIYISNIQLSHENPFEPEPALITVQIIDIKKNYNDTTWVKVRWSDGHVSTMQAIILFEDFRICK